MPIIDVQTDNGTSAPSVTCACKGPCACRQQPVKGAARDRQLAWWLSALTVGWNTLEAAVSIGSGVLAGSIALVGSVSTRWSTWPAR